jgi:hypothetical protein
MRGTIAAEIRASGEPVATRLRIFRCAGRALLYTGRNHLQIRSLAADLEAIRGGLISHPLVILRGDPRLMCNQHHAHSEYNWWSLPGKDA